MVDHGHVMSRGLNDESHRLARDSSSVVLGHGGLVMRLMAAGGVVMIATFVVIGVPGSPQRLSSMLINLALFGLVVSFFVAMLTSRIEGHGDDLVLIDLFTVAVIPAQDVFKVERGNGLLLVTWSGRRYGHIGYGQSLAANFTGNRRAKRTAVKIDSWLAVHNVEPATTTPSRTATRTIRWVSLAIIVAASVLATVTTGLVLYYWG